jgi:hydroxyethylthiazole kinase-like uncharacterized protein yjeF
MPSNTNVPTYILRPEQVRCWLPYRNSTDNKSHGGRTLIWAGQTKMPGAAILASLGASRVGSGYIYVSLKEVVNSVPEAIPWNGKKFTQLNSILIGPGLGLTKSVKSFIQKLKSIHLPVVIDADALTIAAKYNLTPFPPHWIATPHSGELSRLLKVSSKVINANRLQAARAAQKNLGCIVILKGFRTIVAFEKISVVIPTGNVALAKGGSGDVLGGMIAGFLAQNITPEKSALLACYLHGRMADTWVKSGRDYLSLMPSDLINEIPFALAAFRNMT